MKFLNLPTVIGGVTQNYVLAGPASGASAGDAGFRFLVAADMPVEVPLLLGPNTFLGKQTIDTTDAAVTTTVEGTAISHLNSGAGNPAAGYGVSHRFDLHTANRTRVQAANIAVRWTIATNGAQVAELAIQLANAPGVADRFVFSGNGNFKANGTLTAGSSTTVLTDAAGKILTAALNTVAVAQGGTGQTSFANGEVLIGNTTGNTLTKTTLSQGANVTITNGPGSITIAASGGIAWSEVTGTAQAMVVDNGYIASNVAQVVLTLPDTAAVGKVVRVAGKGAGGWQIAQNAGEIIHFGNLDTTTGTGGSLSSNHRRDAVELICVVADTEWMVISAQGNITIT